MNKKGESGMSGNELIKPEEIQSRIYTIRGVQVILDKDLAIFYGVKPIRLREQVKRNIKRFPSDFMFQLTEEEFDLMVSQNAIPSKEHLCGSLPFVFTEQMVGVLSKSLVLGGYHEIFENKKPQINADKRRFVIAYLRSFASQYLLQSEKPIAKQAATQLVNIPWGQNLTKNLRICNE